MNGVISGDVQALAVKSDQEVKFDQEASIVDMKNTLTGELRSVGGSNTAQLTRQRAPHINDRACQRNFWVQVLQTL